MPGARSFAISARNSAAVGLPADSIRLASALSYRSGPTVTAAPAFRTAQRPE
ncbi:hypothetical protein [Streptomyces sp. NPDC057623]|uniref:hypothetical protein n=1 Tax=Streptomyces sp. NPDC057623 TaxID=3346187 RepID=UPI003678CC7C